MDVGQEGEAVRLDRRAAEKLAEHRLVVVAVVPLPHPFVEVATEPPLRNGVMRSAHVGLEVPEEAFDGVCVDVAADVDALRVPDATERERGKTNSQSDSRIALDAWY
jgi:hypothetical protein